MKLREFEDLVRKLSECQESCVCEKCSESKLVEHPESFTIIPKAFPKFELAARKLLKTDNVEVDTHIREVGEDTYEVAVYDTKNNSEVDFVLFEDKDSKVYFIEVTRIELVNGQRHTKEINFPYILTFDGKLIKNNLQESNDLGDSSLDDFLVATSRKYPWRSLTDGTFGENHFYTIDGISYDVTIDDVKEFFKGRTPNVAASPDGKISEGYMLKLGENSFLLVFENLKFGGISFVSNDKHNTKIVQAVDKIKIFLENNK